MTRGNILFSGGYKNTTYSLLIENFKLVGKIY